MRHQAVTTRNTKGNIFWIFHNITINGIMYMTSHVMLLQAISYCVALKGGEIDSVMYLVTSLSTTFSLDYMLWNRKDISKQWKRFDQYTYHFRRFPKEVLRRCFLYNLSHFTLHAVMLILSLFDDVRTEKDDDVDAEWRTTLCLGCNVTSLSSYTYKLMACIDTLITNFGMIWPFQRIPILLCCLFSLLRELVREINQDVERFCQKTSNTLNYLFVLNQRKRYQVVQEMIAGFESLLHVITLYSYVLSFISCCHGLTFILKSFDVMGTVARFNYILYYSLPVVFTGFLSFSAATITDEFTKGFQQIQVLTLYCSRIEKSAYEELKLLLVQLSSRQNGITLGGLFVISKVSFLSFLGAIASYVIVVLQLFPDLLAKLLAK